jgi:hypothetical protein
MSHPVAEYLTDLHQSLGVGVPETSGYPALRNLLNAIGECRGVAAGLAARPVARGHAETLRAGATLGRQVAALLDPETPVPGVTDLKVRPDLKGLGELTVAPGSDKNPDLAIVARWGYAGQGGVVMPGPGMVRNGTRGEGFLDIHLNATTRWKDVPEAVWTYTLGGYQVLKKWLSYRESALLGRPLTGEEAQEFTHHVRRIAAILALHDALNSHYSASIP